LPIDIFVYAYNNSNRRSTIQIKAMVVKRFITLPSSRWSRKLKRRTKKNRW